MELMIGIILILLCLTIGLFIGLMKYRGRYHESLSDAEKLLDEISEQRTRLSKRVDRLLRQKVRSCQAPLYVPGEKVRVVNHRTNPDTVEAGTVHRIDATFTREHATDTIKSSYLYSVSLDRRGANDAIIRILTEDPRPYVDDMINMDFESSDPDVATVDKYGAVTVKKEGPVVINRKSKGFDDRKYKAWERETPVGKTFGHPASGL